MSVSDWKLLASLRSDKAELALHLERLKEELRIHVLKRLEGEFVAYFETKGFKCESKTSKWVASYKGSSITANIEFTDLPYDQIAQIDFTGARSIGSIIVCAPTIPDAHPTPRQFQRVDSGTYQIEISQLQIDICELDHLIKSFEPDPEVSYFYRGPGFDIRGQRVESFFAACRFYVNSP